MRRVFADTSYFLALLNVNDRYHDRVMHINAGEPLYLITTAWVLTEVADAMCRPPNRELFLTFLRDLRAGRGTETVPPGPALFEDGPVRYAARPDKDWSLTDCISFVVMEQHRLTDALTADYHFEQAGFRALLA